VGLVGVDPVMDGFVELSAQNIMANLLVQSSLVRIALHAVSNRLELLQEESSSVLEEGIRGRSGGGVRGVSDSFTPAEIELSSNAS